MSTSPSNHYKINKMLQKYKDDVTLDQIIEELKNITSSNRKNCIQECKEMIRNVQDTTSKKYIRTVQLLQDLEFAYYNTEKIEKQTEQKIQPKPSIKLVHTFEDWIIDISQQEARKCKTSSLDSSFSSNSATSHRGNTDLRLFMNTSDTYSQGEQVYYGRKLIEEYTKYINYCSRQLIIPTPFPNIEIINRTCESITLENGRIIKNPNYTPDHRAPIWFCCFT